MLLGKPLFPGRNVVHQLELITDLLGTPAAEVVAKVGAGWDVCVCVLVLVMFVRVYWGCLFALCFCVLGTPAAEVVA